MDTIDRINIRLKSLKEYVVFLEKYQGIAAAVLEKDLEKRGFIGHYLHLSAEIVIDISNLLNAEYKFRPAQDASESILILGEEGVIEKDFAKHFSKIAGFRNILIHEYLKIDYKIVADNLNKYLADFEKFASQVAKYLT